ncbi:helix-turn-helix domain-containing protein [Brevibacillus sp. 179-C 1.1 NHS]|uniref:helix-turn-helix domain-containing protein n=1 Tax=Brevibacillus sp. 179-C 1.1 NHS TaxID=3235177 RepID=UPI0039A16B54
MIFRGRKLLTLDECADYLNVSRRTVYMHVRDGRLRAYKVGGTWRVEPQDLYDFQERGGR